MKLQQLQAQVIAKWYENHHTQIQRFHYSYYHIFVTDSKFPEKGKHVIQEKR